MSELKRVVGIIDMDGFSVRKKFFVKSWVYGNWVMYMLVVIFLTLG